VDLREGGLGECACGVWTWTHFFAETGGERSGKIYEKWVMCIIAG
jgi:hypothetical protein